jgi:nicotinamide mononucleotide (NMN) deamidase PncC
MPQCARAHFGSAWNQPTIFRSKIARDLLDQLGSVNRSCAKPMTEGARNLRFAVAKV